MGIRDDLFRGATIAAKLGREAAASAAGSFAQWAENRETEQKWAGVDESLEKALRTASEAEAENIAGEAVREPKALHYNPFDLVAAMGYRERPTGMTYAALEMIGRSVPVIADVVVTRCNQVGMFCDLPEDRHGAGFAVRQRDWRTQTVTKATDKRQQELAKLLLYTGRYNPEQPQDSVSLARFAKMMVSDALMFDQATFEIVPDRAGRPSYLSIVDPTTIRLLDPAFRDQGDPFAVQVVDGVIVADFKRDELAFCTRNPRSGIKSYGYGVSELETLVREITGLLWGMEYNRKAFTNGSATKGVLNFKGTIPDKQLQAFRRQWYAMVAGIGNAWRTPITNAEDLQWINMQLSNRDMEYSAWIDFLIKIVCARFQIAPEEVNFSYGNTGQSQAMGQAPLEEKLKASRDLGLRPLVRWLFTQLNMHFLQRLDSDFEAVPVGLDEKGEEAETDLLEKKCRTFMTIDEAREIAELEPLGPDKGGDVINNPTWLQYVQGKEAAAQGMDGAPGEGMPPDSAEDEDAPQPAPPPDEEPPPLDVEEDQAIKSERADRPIVQYTVNL